MAVSWRVKRFEKENWQDLGLTGMQELRKREQSRLTSRFLAWAKAGRGVLFTVKGNIKAVSAQCQVHSKYLVKVSYNSYRKFRFRYVVLAKYPVGRGGCMGQVRLS